MIHILINHINEKIALNEDDILLCKKYFEPITFNKNTIIEEQDKIPNFLYFIVSGFMRLFYYDENGDENTTNILIPGNFIASYLSLIQSTKATENVESITDCELLRIKKVDLQLLIANSENFKEYSLLIFQKALGASDIRANDLATLTAEQRYKKLIETQASILQNVPIQYIASYLGMKPESLSRIRKNLIN